MPWLAELVQSSEGSLDVLPVQCLCEFLLLEKTGDNGKAGDELQDKRLVCDDNDDDDDDDNHQKLVTLKRLIFVQSWDYFLT